MAKPFKPTRAYPIPPDAEFVEVDGRRHVRLRERGKPVLYRVSKDGTKYLRPSKRWYVDYRDANGTVRRVKGFTDLKATEQLANELTRKADRARVGLTDPAEEHALRPLADHLADYGAALKAKGGTPEHAAQTTSRISSLLSGCGFAFLRDVDAGKAAEWLNALRCPVRLELPPDADLRPRDAARLLGITSQALRAAVKRHQLEANGAGKARRLPRETVAFLAERMSRGTGPATVNHYVRAVRGFFRWLGRSKRIGSNPLETLGYTDARTDIRRARRELTAEELQRLFVAARDSGRSFRGLAGPDRFYLYLTAAGTGFRANALANLMPADFDLNAGSPSVTLAARFNKARRLKVQPLPADVAEALCRYLADKPGNSAVWGGTWARDHRGAEMLRLDLEAAGIAYAVEGPDGPEYADFHSLRHSFLTLGGRSGIDLRTLQELAGHSKPELTARYSHRRLHDLTGAVNKLPNLVPNESESVPETIPLRFTGTDGKSAVPGAVEGRIRGHLSASNGTLPMIGATQGDVKQTQKNRPVGADLHQPAAIRMSEDDGTRTRNHRIDSPVL